MRTRLFVTVSEGETATAARPIVVTSDPDAIAAVGRVLAERLGVELSPGRARQHPPDAAGPAD